MYAKHHQTGNKKWRDKEVMAMLDYILATLPNLERPNARTYYTQLIKETGINANWIMVRTKVRYLRICFRKVNKWLSSADSSFLGTDDETEKAISKMCPFYNLLKVIFAETAQNEDTIQPLFVDIAKNEHSEECLQSVDSYLQEEESVMPMRHFSFPTQTSSPERAPTPMKLSEARTQAVKRTKSGTVKTKAAPKESVIGPEHEMSQSSVKEPRANEFRMLQFQLEKQKFENEKERQNKRLHMEESKFKAELEWKYRREDERQERRLRLEEARLEAEKEWKKQEFELKRLQMEKDERIARYEIEMRYKDK